MKAKRRRWLAVFGGLLLSLLTVGIYAEGPSPVSGSCADNGDCDPGYYCHKEECDDAYGSCEWRPDFCLNIWDPVCGCNGVTYSNACCAAMDGMNVAYYGPCQEGCPADFDGDGVVNTVDLLFLLGAWGTPEGDVNDDGDTDADDLLALIAAWGDCP